MKIYEPAETILPGCTDERLNGPNTPFKGEVRRLLLSIPAAYRQPAMAEDHRRTTFKRSTVGEMEHISAGPSQLAAVCDEINAQLKRG